MSHETEIAAPGERAATRQTGARAADHLGTVYTEDGRACGQMVAFAGGEIWLVKDGLDPDRHMLKKPPAWATDAEHLDMLRVVGGAGVRLICRDGTTYEATLETIDRYGFVFDRGHGRQVALPLGRWTRSGGGGP